MLRKYAFAIILCLPFLGVKAQYVDSLSIQLQSLRKKSLFSEGDDQKNQFNAQFSKLIFESIKDNRAFIIDSISNFGLIESSDKKLRLWCWNISFSDQTFHYNCILGFKKGIDWIHYNLNDVSHRVEKPQQYLGTSSAWYGSLYYEIIAFGKKSENQYLLLGWDGNDRFSTMKVVDVLSIDQEGIPHFGKRVFNTPWESNVRIVFEYSSEAVMSLRYYEMKEWLVFDHLSPLQPNMEGMYDYYVPDLSFDALQFRKDKWYFIQNVDVRGDQTMEGYNAPPESPIK